MCRTVQFIYVFASFCNMDFHVYAFGAEQDEGLEKLEETVVSTKHIAMAVNEELDLHTRLIVCSLYSICRI